MAHGVEVRLPFLDNTLIDFAAKLPEACKLEGAENKILLRQLATRRLPARTAHKNKQAFYFPLEGMMHQPEFQTLIHETLDEQTVRGRGIFDVAAVKQLRRRAMSGEFLVLKQLFSLVILELWMQIFIDRQRPV